jgi:uncharacterized 2Fe-2S/4Fe-4S cluster protein (DUF4445 family)
MLKAGAVSQSQDFPPELRFDRTCEIGYPPFISSQFGSNDVGLMIQAEMLTDDVKFRDQLRKQAIDVLL